MSVYTWGSGKRGELGHSQIDKEGVCALPHRVDFSGARSGRGKNAAAAVSAASAASATNDDDHCSDQSHDRMQMVHVACGEGCSGAVSSSGQLYLWGSARHGRLADGSDRDETVSKPQLVTALSGIRVAQLSIGEAHLACVTAGEGALYTWGSGSNGCLGNGSTLNALRPHRVLVGGAASGEPLAAVKTVKCGYRSTGVLQEVETGKRCILLMWGDNSHGKLGLGAGLF